VLAFLNQFDTRFLTKRRENCTQYKLIAFKSKSLTNFKLKFTGKIKTVRMADKKWNYGKEI